MWPPIDIPAASIARAQRELASRLGREPSLAEVAEYLELPVARGHHAVERRGALLDERPGDGDRPSRLVLLGHPAHHPPRLGRRKFAICETSSYT